MPEVLTTAQGRRPRAVLKTEGTVFPYTDRLRPVNNVFIFSVILEVERGELVSELFVNSPPTRASSHDLS